VYPLATVWKLRDLYPSRSSDCLFSITFKDRKFGPPIFLYNRYRGVKLPAFEFDFSLAFNTKVKNDRSCTSAPLCSLTAWTGKNSPCDIYSSVVQTISKLRNTSERFARRVLQRLLFLTRSLLLSNTKESFTALLTT
jgi:hypothetical protein